MTARSQSVSNKPLTKKEEYNVISKYIEIGSYTETGNELGISRQTVTRHVMKFMKDHPEEYQAMLDAFLAKNKMQMIHQNAHTTKKALDKVDELLDDTMSLKEAAMAYGILYDKGALMKGEATSNSAIVIKMAGDVEELSK